MRNLGKLIFQRVVAVSLAVLLQIAAILLVVFFLQDFRQWIKIALTVLSWVFAVIIVSGHSNPSYKIAWVMLILALPVMGVTIYLLLGGNRVSRRERRHISNIGENVRRILRQDPQIIDTIRKQNPQAAQNACYLYRRSGYPVCSGSETEYFPLGELCYARMLELLERAEHYIFLEYFIVNKGQMWDSVLEVLKRKAAEGVEVRMLYDDFGCITRLPANYAKQLAAFGIRAKAVNPFLPIVSGRLNNRDHRKLLIIDGKYAFTGGINLADEYINVNSPYGHWKDCGLLVTGMAAWSMTVMFLTMWDFVWKQDEPIDELRPKEFELPAAANGCVQPFADSPLDEEDIGAEFLGSMIHTAASRVWIMTPYLILDDKMSSALCTAAKSGVDVRIITPGIPDKKIVFNVTRANYEILTEAGVRIYEYVPGFVHSKVYLFDDDRAVVGTVNMDFRSLYLHFENGVYLFRTDTVQSVEQDFLQVFPDCREITCEMCRSVGAVKRLWRSLLRIFSVLM